MKLLFATAAPSQRWPHALALSVLVALAYAAAAQVGWGFRPEAPLVSSFWPASGLALAALLRAGLGLVPAVACGALLAWRLAGTPWPLAAVLAAGCTAGPSLMALWLRRLQIDTRLGHERDLLLLCAGACGSALLAASVGGSALVLAGQVAVLDLPQLAAQWWVADALGGMLAGVALMASHRVPERGTAQPLTFRFAGVLGACLCCALAALAAGFGLPASATQAMGAGLPVALLALPPVLVCGLAFRAGLAPAAGAALLTACVLSVAAAAAPAVPTPGAEAGPAPAALWAYLAMLMALALLPHTRLGELVRREQRWRSALDGSDLGVAEWNMGTGTVYSSSRWRTLLDDPDGEASTTLDRWLGIVHASERQAVRSRLFDTSPTPRAALRFELRLWVRNAWGWFAVSFDIAEREPNGRPLRVVATVTDIAGRRSAQDRERISNNVLLNLHEGLVVTDAELRVVEANPTYCRITGVPHDELIGSVPTLLRSVAQGAPQMPLQGGLLKALDSGGYWSGEVLEQRRSGEACTLQVTLSTVHGPGGAALYHVLVVSDVTEQRAQREQLARQAHFDELTRLPNRARLSQLLAEAMAATDRDGYLLAVCYLDIDHFKAINERHGHGAGDILLAELATRLRSALRARGPTWTDAAARLGGDEFVLLLRAGTVDEARAAVERVLRVVGQPMVLQPGTAPQAVTASMGATIYPLDASDADTLLRHADQAMYGAKQAGRNGYLFFDPEHSRRNEERVVAIGRVQDALDHDELLLYYQPKVDLRSGTVLGVEALLRWNHPEHGVVPPAQFLPLIEHTGLSASVGDHVLARALDQLEAWQADGLDLSVSVNISARHLQEPDFAQRLGELLARHPQPLGARLELEVLETAALVDIGYTSELLERCARMGVRWALDDFGTGYSTLTYLKRLPVQVLKIDRSFVHNMLDDAQDRAIVEGVISLAGTFGCVVVAEGVETTAQSRMLLDMGCQVGQGAGIAAPMPAAEVAAWVRGWKGLFAQSSTLPGAVPPWHEPPAPYPGVALD